MANKIKPRRSYTANSVPLVSDLEENEMAVNWTDGKLFVRQGNAIVTHTLGGSGGGGSAEDTVLRALFVPPAPTNLTATAGDAQASLSWTAPTVSAQTPITDYVVQYSSNSGSTWATFSDGTSTATSATVTGLTNGTAYVFRVAAVNGVGTGSPTAATASVTPSGAVFRAIPAMAGLTAPSGEVVGVGNRGADEDSWKAFDGVNSSSSWVYLNRGPSNSPKRSLQYAFPAGQKSNISGYSMSLDFPSGGEYIPRQWNFYGSDDLATWTLLDSRSDSGTSGGVWFGTSISAGEYRTFTLSSQANYRAYRWIFDETVDTGNSVGLREIALVQ